MTVRRNFLAAAALAASTAPLKSALAQASAPAAKNPDFLFVQNAKSMSYDKAKGRMTLHDVNPVTIFFSDRPDRIAGHMTTSAFVPFWSSGKDSFLKDAPNANVSILENGSALADVVVVLQSPLLAGGNLSYDVKILEGDMPAKGGLVSLFIDVIGMPMTPVSVAGVARRTAYRRAVIR